jgi:hypothetical protein
MVSEVNEEIRGLLGAVVLGAALACVAPAAASEPVRLDGRLRSPGDLLPDGLVERGFRLLGGDEVEAEEPDDEEEEGGAEGTLNPKWDEEEANDLPNVHVELSAQTVWAYALKFKKGRAKDAGTIHPQTDFHLPDIPHYGGRLHLDVRFHRDFMVGVEYERVELRWPRRVIHDTPQTVDDHTIPASVRGRTFMDLDQVHIYGRYVVRHNRNIRFSFGIGVLWASVRLGFRGQGGARLDGIVQDIFFPTINYRIQVRLVAGLSVYYDSVLGLISPARFPSYMTEVRLGLRYEFTEGFELFVAGTSWGGQIEPLYDVMGEEGSSNHKWRRAVWNTAGVEFGTSLRF